MTAKIRRQTVAGLVLASVLLLAPANVAADDGDVTVVKNTVSYTFAQQITFTLEATTSAPVNKVYLFFLAMGDERTESLDVPFVQEGSSIDAAYMHDLRLFPLPPFAAVTYWWQIELGDGKSHTTEKQRFEYTDNRFTWEQLSDEENHITVHWIEGQGDPKFGQTALDIARVSLENINAELRAPLPESIAIYIYDTQSNLDGAMAMAGRDWASGQAHPDLGVVVVPIPPDDFSESRMNRYIPHELTHLLVYQAATPEGYRYVPEWLDEGLATANERLPTPEYALVLDEARLQGRLIPLQDLCVPFPPDPQSAFLSYAQSGSVVQCIRQRYGAQSIRNLLAAYKNGASCSSGVEEALGTSLNGLETAWRASLEPQPQTPWRVWAQQIGPWVGLWLLGLLVALPMIGRVVPARRVRRQ